MNSKKIQAQMQINVSFLGDTTKLTKQLQDTTKQLKLDGSFTKQLETSLSKGFKDVYSNIEKMSEGLSKKGLSSKQYMAFFNEMNAKLKESIKFTQDLKKDLQAAFNSPENKQALKDLEKYKKQLEEIRKLSVSKKGASTRAETATRKMKEETGIDYNIAKRTLSSIASRKANNQGLTKAQQEWMAANGLDEAKLKRVLELLKQINAQTQKQKELNEKAKQLTGQSGVDSGEAFLTKQISHLEANVITPETHKHNMSVTNSIEEVGGALENAVNNQIPRFRGELSQSELEAEKLAKAGSTLNEIFAQFGISFSVGSLIKGFKDLVVSSFEFYKSLDSALNEIYVVSNLSSEAVNGLKTDFINMAKNTGMALDDITRSATLFYQQGLNTAEVMEMTRVTSEFAKVAGIDATDAADKLTAAVNGYCLAAEDAALVADKFNKVAAASAADIDELSTAFSKAAAQANQAGVGMDNYLAYIATMVEATREAPENIGTSLKTIMSRMQQVKMGGTTEDGETDVNQVETALESVGVALRDVNGELRDLEDVFAELGPKWQSLDRNTQAYLGTIIAGTRQQSRFITLMQNWDRVLDLADQSANSAGQQALMHAKAMDSIESKVQQFQVAWQEFISNLTNSDVIKGIVSIVTKLLDVFNDGNKPIALLAMGIGLLGNKLKELQDPLKNRLKDFAAFFKTSKGAITGNYFTTDAEKNKAIELNKNAQLQNEAELNKLVEEQRIKYEQIVALKQKMLEKNELAEDDQEELNKLTEDQLRLQEEINKKRKNGNDLSNQGNKLTDAPIMTKAEAVGKAMGQIGMAVNTVGIMIGQVDDNLGGVVSSLGTATSMIGQFASGNWIGGITSAITLVYQVAQTIINWDDNVAKRLSDAVDKVSEVAQDASNKTVAVNASKDLLKEYNQLSTKIVKTAAEQERLNMVAQQLGDTHGVDVLTDSYGNLTVSINEVTQAMEKMEDERNKAAEELRKAETTGLLDATGFFNENTVTDYYDELLSTNRTAYKSMLKGVDEQLSDETRNISANLAKEFSSNFVNSVYDQVASNALSYTGETLVGAMTRNSNNINEKLDDKAWNQLYAQIGQIESEINNLSYNDVEARLEEFYNTWGKANDITMEEWNILKDSINNTVFENKTLLDFYSKVEEMNSKATGAYYSNEEGTGALDKINAQIAEVDAKDATVEGSGALLAGGGVVGGLAAFGAVNGWNPVGWGALAAAGIGAVIGGIVMMNSEEAKQQRALNKTRKELEKERNEYLDKIDEENAYLHSREDAAKWIEAQTQVAETMKTLTSEQQNYLGNMDSLFNFDELNADQSQQYADTIDAMTKGMKSFHTDTSRANYLVEYANKMLADPELEEEVRKKWEAVLDDAMSNLQLPRSYTFSQLADEIDSISTNLRTMNQLVADFEETGSMTLDDFKSLAKIMDSIKLEDLYAASDLDNGINYVTQYTKALKDLDLAFDGNAGRITMNGEALKSLQEIQEIQMKTEITNMKNQLIAKKYQTLAEIGYIDAQIAGAEAALSILNTKDAAQITSAELTETANNVTKQSFTDTTNKLNELYSTDVQNMNTWTMAVVSNLDTATQAWGKYWAAAAGSDEDLSALKKEAEKGQNVQFEKATEDNNMFTDAAGSDGKFSKDEVAKLKEQLNTQITQLKNLREKYYQNLELYENQIGFLEKMEGADLSNFGVDGAGEELEKYIGKLKEIYNILNRIQNLEHRLSTLDTYSEIAVGAEYGEYYKDRLKYTEELSDQYKFLVTEQKKFANGYKEFIENSAVGDVFDFDEFGQIIIDFEKYNALQDTAADGEKSLKEQADELYETYTSMYEELQGYFDEYITYLQKAIELHQEAIDSYVEVENNMANAIKEIYQKMLDTKLEAIDREKEALDELREAREQARKDKENAEAISGLQTDMQRAMMDTSGASDISFIKAQKDMNDKLEDIAEDKYSEMLDNIIAQLDEEKEALQENFDEMFENMDWVFEFLEDNIMNDKEKIEEILTQTDDWQQKSNLERKQQLETLGTQYETYMAAMRGSDGEEGTIYGVWTKLEELKGATKALDEALKTREVNVGSAVANAIANGIQAATGGGGGGGLGGNITNPGGKNPTDNPNGNDTGDEEDETPPPPTTYPYYGGMAAMVGKTVELEKNTKYRTYGTLEGASPSTYTSPKNYEENVTVVSAPEWSEKLQMWLVKLTDTGAAGGHGTRYFAASADTHGQGFSRYFHDRGWGKSGKQYLTGGFADYTGPAWLDGTPQKPEAVLNALQTEHFIKFTEALDRMYSSTYAAQGYSNGTVNIGAIEFNVESMSSVEDGERAFAMFVDKFKEIGDRTGIKINTFKNTL